MYAKSYCWVSRDISITAYAVGAGRPVVRSRAGVAVVVGWVVVVPVLVGNVGAVLVENVG